MFNIIKEEINWCGRNLTIETGRLARQADGAVLITYGETSVLCTAVMSRTPKLNIDFLPLTVNYREMTFAAGKIPGGFFKREGRASEKETLISRLIDRTIRPLFRKGFTHEIQVVCTVLSYDGENDADNIAIIGASCALMISGIPFIGPVAATKVGMIDDHFILNPTIKESATSHLDLSVAGTEDHILMVEAGANEVNEAKMLEALELGHNNFKPVIAMVNSIKAAAGKEMLIPEHKGLDEALTLKTRSIVEKDLEEIYLEKIKQVRYKKLADCKAQLLTHFNLAEESESEFAVVSAFKSLQYEVLRRNILHKQTRIDGRGLAAIRPITAEVSALHRTHGSAIFTRGETQAVVVTTLGSGQDEQMLDSLDGNLKERFMLHYNFPGYSVGEVSPLRAPGRREIGHGKLAWRALYHVLPSKDQFPYTIRTVAEITESNGSSSMATICGASLSLMDAGVPIKKPVAGIAMGLIKENDKFAILSDILGDEDYLGDMDFKVGGTKDGITVLQMDIKVTGITLDIMKTALSQALDGRLWILDQMAKALSEPRADVNKYAPSITSISVAKDKIGLIIGPGGKTIKDICEKSGAKIDIDDNGVISIAAVNVESANKAAEMINSLVSDVKIGEIYEGTVVKILDFGAVVSFLGSKEGLLHISEISETRVESIHDVLKEGDKVNVRIVEIDERKRKVRLSMKAPSENDTPRERSYKDSPRSHSPRSPRRTEPSFNRNERPSHSGSGGDRRRDNDRKGSSRPNPNRDNHGNSQSGNSQDGNKNMKYFNF